MDIEKMNAFAKQGESKKLEYKSSTSQIKSAFETICAFLNGEGGTVLIGVKDKGQIVGQHVSDSTRLEIANEIKKIEPAALIDIHYIGVKEDKFVIALHVKAGTHIPYIYDGRAFQRTESGTNRMSQHRYEQLLVKRGQLNHSWEKFPAEGYSIHMLDKEEIQRTVIEGIAGKRIPATIAKAGVIKILGQLDLMTEEGKIKNASVALFAKEIRSPYKQCWLKMARFKGIDKSENVIDSQQVYCNIFRMLEAANNFFQKHLPMASYFKTDEFKRIDKPALPTLAVREALVNAICHRDHEKQSGYISIAIFDDRMEIWSNGTLPEGIKLKDLKREHDSILRNELMARVFYLRGYVEAWGIGTTRMVDLCKSEGIPVPVFAERTGGFVVRFKFSEPIGRGNITQKKELTVRQKEIISLLKKSSLNSTQVARNVKHSPSLRTVQIDLKKLEKAGLISREGENRSTIWKALK